MHLFEDRTNFSLFGTKEELKLLKDIIAGADPYKYGHKECEQLYNIFNLNKVIVHSEQITDKCYVWEVSFPKTDRALTREDLREAFPDYYDCFFSAFLYEKNGRLYYRVGGYKK